MIKYNERAVNSNCPFYGVASLRDLPFTYYVLRFHMSPGYKHVAPLGLKASQVPLTRGI